MKGDPGRYDNVQAYREGYDRIDWSKTGDPDREAYRKMEKKLFGGSPFTPRPADAPLKTNGGIVCDMDRGPCACGATHGL